MSKRRILTPKSDLSWDPSDTVEIQRLPKRADSDPISYDVWRNDTYIGRVISITHPRTIQFGASKSWRIERGDSPETLVRVTNSRPTQEWAILLLIKGD